MKKILSVILAVVLLVSIVPMGIAPAVSAAETERSHSHSFGDWSALEFGASRACACGYEEFVLDYTYENITLTAPAGVFELETEFVFMDVVDFIDAMMGGGYIDKLYYNLAAFTFGAFTEESLGNLDSLYVQPNGEITVKIVLGEYFSENTQFYFGDESGEEIIQIFPEIENRVATFTLSELGTVVMMDMPETHKGWNSLKGNMYYFNEFGELVVEAWVYDSGNWYFTDSFGMKQTGWVEIYGLWYYFDASGVMKTGWLNDNGTWYYLNDYSGSMVTGWKNIGGVWYYFNSSGAMQTGWLYDGGWYYLNSSGAMATGWLYDGGWYYLDASGMMTTGWLNDGGVWYYLSGSGAMQTGWLQIGAAWYYFGSSGVMATGWQNIGGTWYYFYSSGAMAANCLIDGCWLSASGAWV